VVNLDKRIKVSLDGQSKGVVASVSIEYSGEPDNIKNEDVLKETIDIFREADKFATLKTIEKMR
jgi:hypothetical protein